MSTNQSSSRTTTCQLQPFFIVSTSNQFHVKTHHHNATHFHYAVHIIPTTTTKRKLAVWLLRINLRDCFGCAAGALTLFPLSWVSETRLYMYIAHVKTPGNLLLCSRELQQYIKVCSRKKNKIVRRRRWRRDTTSFTSSFQRRLAISDTHKTLGVVARY